MNDTCRRCGVRLLPHDDHALCAGCLLAGGRTPGAPAQGAFAAPSIEELAHRFPQLDVLELVGQGGMGAVYRCRQPRLDRLVALKVLRPGSEEDPAFTERFLREARVLARLDHPGVVRVHDFGVDGALHWLLMEYVDGSSLREVLEAGKLPPADALALVPQICEALQYAHDNGVVHRDIKPENLLLDGRGRVRIADFGLARLDDREADAARLTGTHEVFGTPRYMAPEQLEGARAVDHRADIYALGAVFYELLTGELPLGRFEPPSHRAAGVDARVDAVVMRTLEKEPGRRYQRASEVRDALADLRRAPAGASEGRPPHELIIGAALPIGALVLALFGVREGVIFWPLMALFFPGAAVGAIVAMRSPGPGLVALALGLLIGSLGVLVQAMTGGEGSGWSLFGLIFFITGLGQGHWNEQHGGWGQDAAGDRPPA